jgi:hypothetical protein
MPKITKQVVDALAANGRQLRPGREVGEALE